MDISQLLMLDKEQLAQASKNLNADNISILVDMLNEKDDKLRYQAFLMLQSRSQNFDDVYAYWNIFCDKLKSSNSYQRSIGLMMIAENVKWDNKNQIDNIIDDYLLLLNDQKPITVRQCIQSLAKIIPYKNHLNEKIANSLIDINLDNIKQTMRKLVLIDILNVLILIRKNQKIEIIDAYIVRALSEDIIDKKAKKQIEELIKD